MKAVVFAYHDIGCIGIEALLKHGIAIEAIHNLKKSRLRLNSRILYMQTCCFQSKKD
jgi:hypothetical protein